MCITEFGQAIATLMKGLPFIQHHNVVLQVDNTRPDRVRIVQQFLQQNVADRLDWPDLSPIEHVLDILGQRA